jgi:hypothetical protein
MAERILIFVGYTPEISCKLRLKIEQVQFKNQQTIDSCW